MYYLLLEKLNFTYLTSTVGAAGLWEGRRGSDHKLV